MIKAFEPDTGDVVYTARELFGQLLLLLFLCTFFLLSNVHKY